jgi:hypothetical protein
MRAHLAPTHIQFACLYGYLVPHPQSRLVVGICAFMYFALVSFMTVYLTFFDPGYLPQAVRRVPDVSVTVCVYACVCVCVYACVCVRVCVYACVSCKRMKM